MAQLPGGTVTLLFTDIQGSTALLQVLGDRYGILLADHHRILRGAFAAHGGTEVDSAGDGLFTTFPSARAGLLGAIEAQRGIAAATWPGDATVRVRMGLHTGEPRSGEGGYVGIDVHRAARICAAGHGGQILVSQTSRELLTNDLPADVSLLDLGEHRLKGIDEAQRLFQVAAPGLADSFGPLRTAGGRPNNLPRELTSFVGRDRQLEAASRILATTPLLTLVGPGGVGKTRLALRLAVEHLDEYDEGAWLVELGSVEDGALVFQTVAATMAIAEQPGKDIATAVLDHLRTGSRLLILDNCEHVLEATADAVHRVLATCPDVRILATSREGLGVPGEALYPVPSLSLPEATTASVAAVGRSEAVALFVERAAAVRPEFRVGPETAAAIAQLVRRLDGIPLALELAAARTRVLTVDQIAARLDDQFRLLTGGSRVAVPRHQTLQATMDWSYDLLTDDERAVLRRLAVFAGSLSLEAAESICGIDPVDPVDVLDLLTRLVDKSLVVAEPSGDGRYRLLETIRQYARDRLIEADEAEVDPAPASRPGTWHSSNGPRPSSSTAPSPVPGSSGSASSTTTCGRPSSGAPVRPTEPVVGLRLATGLWRFWEIRGHPHEGRAGSSGRSRRSGPTGPALLVADALIGAGGARFHAGRRRRGGRVRRAQPRHPAPARRPDGDLVRAQQPGRCRGPQGRLRRARGRLYDECVALTRTTGDERGLAFALINLAGVAADLGDEAGGQGRVRRERRASSSGSATAGGSRSPGTSSRPSSPATATRRRRGSAPREALTTWLELGDERGVARVARPPGRRRRASTATSPRRGGRPARAWRSARRSATCRASPAAMEKLAWVMVPDQPEAAARLIGSAEALREAIRAPIPAATRVDHARRLAALTERLGEATLRGCTRRRAGRWPRSRSSRRCRPELEARVLS